jgi:hypothetical protein
MASILPQRALRTSSAIALATLFALLVPTPAAHAGVSDSASFGYTVTRFDYHAGGQLSGGLFGAVCTPTDALWEGEVTTDDSQVAPLGKVGDASLKIHRHGTSGEVEAKTSIESKFTGFHRETTACEKELESAHTESSCAGGVETEMTALVDISGGVGTRVRIAWNFFEDNGDRLVPNTFTCGEPFKFSDPSAGVTCSKGLTANLAKLTAKIVKLPFFCLYTATAPPPGTNYTKFGSTVTAKGALFLKRTKMH